MPLLNLPNELLLQVTETFYPKDLHSLVKTNRQLATLLTPTLNRLAAKPGNRICALLWAAAMGDEKMIRQLVANGAGYVTLLSSGAKPSSQPPKPKKSDEDIVRLVLEKGANLIVTTKSPGYVGWEAPAFLHAMKYNYQTLTMLLLEKGANATWVDRFGQNLLHHAASTCASETVIRKIIERGADVFEKASPMLNEITPLYQAAQYANVLLVRILIEHGADTMSRNSTEYNVFHVVLRGQCDDCLVPLLGPDEWIAQRRNATIRTLLKYGNTALADNHRNTGLHVAAVTDDTELAEVLLQRGVKVDAPEHERKTPLHLAAHSNSSALALLLLENGANVNARDIHGYTPLHFAAKSGSAKVAKILVEAGADMNAQDCVGKTPLHLSARLKHTGTFRLLLWKGVDLTIPENRHNATALHFSAKWGDDVMVRMLLGKGADFTVRNKNGETPLLLAAKYGHVAVVRILHENGADIFAKDGRERGAPEWVTEEVLVHPERCIMETPNISTVNRLRREKDKGVCYETMRDFCKTVMFR